MTRHLALVLLGTFAVSFINPSGFGVVVHPFAHLFGDDFLFDFTREFTSPDFHNPMFWPFLAMIVISVVLSFRWSATNLLLAGSWTAFALYAFRNIPLYALVITPILAGAITPWWPSHRSTRLANRWKEYSTIERSVIGGSLSVILIVVTAFTMSRSPGSGFDFSSGSFPVQAVETVRESPPGDHVFNQFVWGGYLVYCCHPEIPVFIDGQTDYYGPELTREYDRAIRGLPGWREVFDKYDIDWVLISPDSGLAQVLAEADDWRERYRDDTAVVFVPSA